ncbi:uncharacterized protein EAF02_003415 [Botrytis sinoallii]|uniref:uncharacterized protein n=1 Tax=Botrytis sinoallii TaxID=1463999 RepID=UPI001900EA2C|nr:uncharacterized protein EAF02_003415 [Botrytis sinoallii]KAF7886768.1 hypothetical protein EAF02_003415 [Botrytis sinoallii]
MILLHPESDPVFQSCRRDDELEGLKREEKKRGEERVSVGIWMVEKRIRERRGEERRGEEQRGAERGREEQRETERNSKSGTR